MLFAGYLIQEGKKSTTIKCYLSAVRAVLKTQGFKLNEDMYLMSALTRACKLKNDVIKLKSPITRGILDSILNTISELFKADAYKRKMYRALFSTAYHGLFRIGEVTQGPHVIKATDVFIGTNKNKVKFILHSSKTHRKGDKPQIVKIKSEPSLGSNQPRRNCPFQILREFFKARKPFTEQNEQFFVFQDGSPVKPSDMQALLTTCLELNNKNPDDFSVHGLRTGCSTDLLSLGVSVETIKKLGRWKSNAVFTYLR